MLNYQKKLIGEEFAAIFKALTSFIRPAHSGKTTVTVCKREEKSSEYFSMNLLLL
jgi:hypothetical protein